MFCILFCVRLGWVGGCFVAFVVLGLVVFDLSLVAWCLLGVLLLGCCFVLLFS